MKPRDWNSYATFFFLLALFWLGTSVRAEAAPEHAKGPFSGISPLVRIFSEGSGIASAGINVNAKPEKGSLQSNNIEIHYLWQPTDSLSVAKIQFHSSAPGNAYVRLYEAEGGRPGRLLAETGFKSQEYGWQGNAFSQPVQVHSGSSYFVSYVHEKDIKDYVTMEQQREVVSFYWNDYDFSQAIQQTASLQAPKLTRVKAYESQIKVEWEAVTGHSDLYGYAVFRNGTEIGMTKNTYFIDELGAKPEKGTFTYTVRAVQSPGLVSPFSNPMDVTFGDVEIAVPPVPEPLPEMPPAGGGTATVPTAPTEPTIPTAGGGGGGSVEPAPTDPIEPTDPTTPIDPMDPPVTGVDQPTETAPDPNEPTAPGDPADPPATGVDQPTDAVPEQNEPATPGDPASPPAAGVDQPADAAPEQNEPATPGDSASPPADVGPNPDEQSTSEGMPTDPQPSTGGQTAGTPAGSTSTTGNTSSSGSTGSSGGSGTSGSGGSGSSGGTSPANGNASSPSLTGPTGRSKEEGSKTTADSKS